LAGKFVRSRGLEVEAAPANTPDSRNKKGGGGGGLKEKGTSGQKPRADRHRTGRAVVVFIALFFSTLLFS
jgi:hypothetical protein